MTYTCPECGFIVQGEETPGSDWVVFPPNCPACGTVLLFDLDKKPHKASVHSQKKLTIEQKRIVRMCVRRIIRQNNARSLFEADDCQCWFDGCELGHACPAEHHKLMACSAPECFTINYIDTPLGDLVAILLHFGLNSLETDHGWATIVSRLISRSDRFGHFMNIDRLNLWRFE